MTDNNNYKHQNDNVIKKIFLFLVAVLTIVGIFIFAFPGATTFFIDNFEYILLGVVIILGSLVLMSMVNLKYPETDKGYREINKIVTLEA